MDHCKKVSFSVRMIDFKFLFTKAFKTNFRNPISSIATKHQ